MAVCRNLSWYQKLLSQEYSQSSTYLQKPAIIILPFLFAALLVYLAKSLLVQNYTEVWPLPERCAESDAIILASMVIPD